MNILSIGNSFSQDAQRYLHNLAKNEGEKFKCVNLYIGGCSLRTHYLNILDDLSNYLYEFNGENTGLKVSVRQALVSEQWDYVTIQQASPLSGVEDSYYPYVQTVVDYVRKYCPKTKIIVHQTWAYEDGSDMLKKVGFNSSKEMLSAVCDCYDKCAKIINADGIIPCGETMYKAMELGLEKVHRDTFHASLGAGRYLLALCWYKYLTKKDVTNNNFNDFDLLVTNEEREIVIKAVNETIK